MADLWLMSRPNDPSKMVQTVFQPTRKKSAGVGSFWWKHLGGLLYDFLVICGCAIFIAVFCRVGSVWVGSFLFQWKHGLSHTWHTEHPCHDQTPLYLLSFNIDRHDFYCCRHPFEFDEICNRHLLHYLGSLGFSGTSDSRLPFSLVPKATVSYNSCKSFNFSISLLKKLKKEILLDWNLNLTLGWPCRGPSRSNSSRFSFCGYKF